ncbi:MAG: hypothetical protein HUJ26_22995 [Planctomycetaceae bacterium]|nr:hypothetical protein [Planctomycetaceae bacterium]
MPILLFTIVVFVSVLIHELGHAVTARRFGWPPHITLYHFGGLASYQPTYGYTPARRVLISLAGPGAGFVLFGIIYAAEQYLIRNHVAVTPVVGYLIVQFKFVNLWWGLLNLLPIYPLDGGQVAEQVCRKINPYRGMENTFKLGIIVAVIVAIFAWQRMGQTYMALMFLFLAFNNYQFLEQTRGRGGPGSPW